MALIQISSYYVSKLMNVFHCSIPDYKEKIGFTGQFLIEPKAKEPTKHQFDYGK